MRGVSLVFAAIIECVIFTVNVFAHVSRTLLISIPMTVIGTPKPITNTEMLKLIIEKNKMLAERTLK